MDLLVFSHLRWDFVYQRPQHLISRFARRNRVWFWEEPVFDTGSCHLEIGSREKGLRVCKPHLAIGLSEQEIWNQQREMLNDLLTSECISDFAAWYYTPMAMPFSEHLKPAAVVYDCMDELSAFRGAPPGLRQAEAELFDRADLVFTGGQSLYESKRNQHPHVHAFPSSIDAPHFQQARQRQSDPLDQARIPHPRIGYAGVIDERLDVELLRGAAELRPEWHFVMVGPVVKISQEDLPQNANVHYLGGKEYTRLPAYLAGWEIGMLPFARNEATRFISPTKTPEYLAAGLPVVSTSIRDVVRPYGHEGLVEIADTPEAFVAACERLLPLKQDSERLHRTDTFLAGNSWELTWERMNGLLTDVFQSKTPAKRYETDEMSNASA